MYVGGCIIYRLTFFKFVPFEEKSGRKRSARPLRLGPTSAHSIAANTLTCSHSGAAANQRLETAPPVFGFPIPTQPMRATILVSL